MLSPSRLFTQTVIDSITRLSVQIFLWHCILCRVCLNLVRDFYSLERAAALMDLVQQGWLLAGHHRSWFGVCGVGGRSWDGCKNHPPSDVLGLLKKSEDVSIAVWYFSGEAEERLSSVWSVERARETAGVCTGLFWTFMCLTLW